MRMAHSMEIERRFLIDGRSSKPWRNGLKSSAIKQYYLDHGSFLINDLKLNYRGIYLLELSQQEVEILDSSNHWTSRIRFVDERAILTMKEHRSRASAMELEWDIITKLAVEVIGLEVLSHVEKTRYYWKGSDGLMWEVDEFEGGLAGLILAEVELLDESQEVIMPEWLGMELTGLKNWSNASLALTLADRD